MKPNRRNSEASQITDAKKASDRLNSVIQHNLKEHFLCSGTNTIGLPCILMRTEENA